MRPRCVRIPIKATAREPIKQAGYISATSAIYAQSLLRNAAGPYIRVTSRHGNVTTGCPLLPPKLALGRISRLRATSGLMQRNKQQLFDHLIGTAMTVGRSSTARAFAGGSSGAVTRLML